MKWGQFFIQVVSSSHILLYIFLDFVRTSCRLNQLISAGSYRSSTSNRRPLTSAKECEGIKLDFSTLYINSFGGVYNNNNIMSVNCSNGRRGLKVNLRRKFYLISGG